MAIADDRIDIGISVASVAQQDDISLLLPFALYCVSRSECADWSLVGCLFIHRLMVGMMTTVVGDEGSN